MTIDKKQTDQSFRKIISISTDEHNQSFLLNLYSAKSHTETSLREIKATIKVKKEA